uniref:Verprolin-like n=1 Tax=Nicotiana tabacum TaxID=4097 RepID=A0A1S4D0U5_TOBAC|nr:PREDICTED: verprolin-like [Nicotiana tabacum]
MPKSSQKSSSKIEAKPKNMKLKSNKSANLTSEPPPIPVPSPPLPSTIPATSSHVPVVPTIPTSTRPSVPKLPSHAPMSASKNTSKPTKIKSTSIKCAKIDKVVIDVASKEDTVVKEAMAQGAVSTTTDHVKLPPSKLVVLVSAIEVAPLDIVPPLSYKPHMEEPTAETDTAT